MPRAAPCGQCAVPAFAGDLGGVVVEGVEVSGYVRALAAVADERLGELRTGTPHAERGEVRTSVHRCLLVVLRKHVDHRRYARRDLAVLTRG